MRHVRSLRKAERQELERMKRQEIGRVAVRAQMILLSARGYSVPEIAEIQQMSDVTVYHWLDRFDEEGPPGLYDRERSGRPRQVDAETEAVLEEAVTQSPTEMDYNFTYWTLPLLARYLEEAMDKSLCHETIRTHLLRLGFRWRRPRWAVEHEDPESAKRMWSIYQTVMDADEQTVILIEDETILNTLPPLRRMWMRKGQQVRIPTPRQNDKIYLYGALDLDSGEWVHAFYEKGKSVFTIAYLEYLLDQYPQQSILLFWDQARYHTSHKVTSWLANHARIKTILLPKYAPKLNPVESIWRQLKDQVAANLNRSLSAIQDAVNQFFHDLPPNDLLNMAGLLDNS